MTKTVEIKVTQVANTQMNVWYSRSMLVKLMHELTKRDYYGGFWDNFVSSRAPDEVNVPLSAVSHVIKSLFFKSTSDQWLYAEVTLNDTPAGKLAQGLVNSGHKLRGRLAAIGTTSTAREVIGITAFTIHIDTDNTSKSNTLNAPLDSI